MKIKKVVVGPISTNCYIVFDEKTKKGVIIDPGGDADKIIKDAQGIDVVYILNTHGHFDHIAANNKLQKYFQAKVVISEKDAPMLVNAQKNYSLVINTELVKSSKADLLVYEGQSLEVGNLKFKVIAMPGHSPGSIGFLIKNHLFSGDVLFKSGFGITFSEKDHNTLMKSIKEKIFTLPDETVVHPGHNLETTVKEEKNNQL
jgi:glyoxylase-like metal-dependent hydrolase (beta-lactamase superfamily II)